MNKIIFFSFFLLTSCFPMTSQYFRPSGVGGKNIDSICGSGPKDTIEFTTEKNVKFFLKVHENKKKRIWVKFSIPKDSKVQLLGNIFIIKDNFSSQETKIRQDIIESNSQDSIKQQYRFDEILFGDSYIKKTNYWEYHYNKMYSLLIDIDKYNFKNFLLITPNFLVNDKLFKLPEIKFKLDTDLSFYFVNC